MLSPTTDAVPEAPLEIEASAGTVSLEVEASTGAETSGPDAVTASELLEPADEEIILPEIPDNMSLVSTTTMCRLGTQKQQEGTFQTRIIGRIAHTPNVLHVANPRSATSMWSNQIRSDVASAATTKDTVKNYSGTIPELSSSSETGSDTASEGSRSRLPSVPSSPSPYITSSSGSPGPIFQLPDDSQLEGPNAAGYESTVYYFSQHRFPCIFGFLDCTKAQADLGAFKRHIRKEHFKVEDDDIIQIPTNRNLICLYKDGYDHCGESGFSNWEEYLGHVGIHFSNVDTGHNGEGVEVEAPEPCVYFLELCERLGYENLGVPKHLDHHEFEYRKIRAAALETDVMRGYQ
ncbi:hypothetical protein BJ508DRAFT_359242 [Ascobolus immersus RN42]|uniref:Uncharacterized protein n=1 Tax=Ascobolus immersus RN42 TaxID=1160509 RepID=A0A3N4IIA4_ASCIM|nr:hypothetical protein BJ508DRAFT_359242 [Ascobolus immersus RN42]